MATALSKGHCITCGKEKVAYTCVGCSQEFCFNHLADHRQVLGKQLDIIEFNRDVIRQTLTEQIDELQKHPRTQEIDQWESDSINRIRQTADEARQLILEQTTGHIAKLEAKLTELTDQLREIRQENDYNEIDLNKFQEKLTQLTGELDISINVSIRQDSKPFVNKIFVDVPELVFPTHIDDNTRWIQDGVTVAGGNGKGNGVNQLNHPYCLYIDDDQTIYIADYSNDRIVEWKSGATSGRVVAGGNGRGDQTDQLNHPSDVIVDKENDSLIISDQGNRRVVLWSRENGKSGQIIISNIDCSRLVMDNNGYLYVSDYKKHDVTRWRMGDTSGTVVAGFNGKGIRLDQLDTPTHIFFDHDHSLYVSDTNNRRVIKWMDGAKVGMVVVGGQALGNSLTQFSKPYGMNVDRFYNIYVAEYNNHRVIRWLKGATQGSVVAGGNGQGEEPNQLNGPIGLSFDSYGNLYVVDWGNHRVQKFNIDPSSTF